MISVQFNQEEYRRITRAAEKVKHRGLFWFTAAGGDFNRRCAEIYSRDVLRAISQMGRPNPPYSVFYVNWKYEYGRMGYPSPWRLFGDLIQALTAFKFKKGKAAGWMGGIPGGVYDSGGKSWYGKGDKGYPRPIAKYARANEFGWSGPITGGPARPVFRPARELFMQTSLPDLKKNVMLDIKHAWS